MAFSAGMTGSVSPACRQCLCRSSWKLRTPIHSSGTTGTVSAHGCPTRTSWCYRRGLSALIAFAATGHSAWLISRRLKMSKFPEDTNALGAAAVIVSLLIIVERPRPYNWAPLACLRMGVCVDVHGVEAVVVGNSRCGGVHECCSSDFKRCLVRVTDRR